MRTLRCTYTVRPILRSVCTGSTVLTLKYCSRRDKYRYKNLMNESWRPITYCTHK